MWSVNWEIIVDIHDAMPISAKEIQEKILQEIQEKNSSITQNVWFAYKTMKLTRQTFKIF